MPCNKTALLGGMDACGRVRDQDEAKDSCVMCLHPPLMFDTPQTRESCQEDKEDEKGG